MNIEPGTSVIAETCQKYSADITIIVHSDDENLTRVLHEICSSAVKRAVGPLGLDKIDGVGSGFSRYA